MATHNLVLRPRPVAPSEAELLAACFKALGDPARLRLFLAIASHDEPLCVCDLPDVGLGQPTVSHHLRKLREASLIDCERRGTWVFYWPTEQGAAATAAIARLRSARDR